MDFDSPWDFVWLAQMAALIVAVMAMLVVCCLPGLDFSAPGSFVPELLCTALVAGLHAWKRDTLLSIGVGTVAYMLLVQLVF